METIKFEKTSRFLGRNGMCKSSGIVLSKGFSDDQEIIELIPLTSKGNTGRAFLDVPVNHLPELIAALQTLLPDEDKAYQRACEILLDGEDEDGNEVSVRDQIKLIREFDGDPETFIDDIDGVSVWGPLVYLYTVSRFRKDIL